MEMEDKEAQLEEPLQIVRGSNEIVPVPRRSDHGQPSLPRTSSLESPSQGDGHPRSIGEHESVTWFVILLTISASLGGFIFGYDTGVVSGAVLLIVDEFDLTDTQEEVIVSITIATAAASSLAGGPAMQRWGRKPVIIFAGSIFTIGAVLLAAAQTYSALVVGRFVVGIGIGLASLATPVYIAEAAPSHLRGKFVTLNTLFITGGQVIAGIVDGLFCTTNGGWRYMLGISGVPAVLMTIGFFFLPESPRWLVAKGHRRMALLTLQKIRGVPNVHDELEEILESVTEYSTVGNDHLKVDVTVAGLIEDPRIRRALVLGCGLQLLQQLCGINTLMYYSATICSMAGFGDEVSIWLSAVTAAAQSVGVCLGLYFIEIHGRRPLVLVSLALVVASLAWLGLGFVLYNATSSNTYGWFVVSAMMAYLLTFGFGMSGIPWVINAEIYPTHARSLGTSASTTTNWLGNALVSATFLTLADSSLGKAGTFWLYGVIGAAGWLWLYRSMPETKGLPLEEVELLFIRRGDPSPTGVDEAGGGDRHAENNGTRQQQGAHTDTNSRSTDQLALLDNVSSGSR